MPQHKPLKTYWRHRKVSVVDWSQCLVDSGHHDKPVFSDGDDSTCGMSLRSKNKEIPKAKDFSSDEDSNSSCEDLYFFDKQETRQGAFVIGKSKKKKCRNRKPKEEQRQKGAARMPVKWPEINNDINFSDIEAHSLIISNSPLIEGYLEPVESPEPFKTKDDRRLVLDPVPVLCSTPQVDLRRNGRSVRDDFSENLSDVGRHTLPPSTVTFSCQSEKNSFCKDSYKAYHGCHGDCSLGDASARLSVQLDGSSRGIYGSGLTPGIMKTTEKQFSRRLVLDSSMDMFSFVTSRAEETDFDRSDANESISKMEMSLSTHEIHNTSKDVVACSTDQATDEMLNETEDSKCLSRIMEEEDEAIGSESKDEGGSESEDEGAASVMSSDEEDVIGSQKCNISTDEHDRICVHESSERGTLHDQTVSPAATRVHDVQLVDGREDRLVTPPSKMPLPLQEALQKSARNMKEMLTPLRLPCLDRVPTFEEKVLFQCEQTQPRPFSSVLPDRLLKSCSKIGEGVYGEVFRIQQKGERLAVKIIPIEGTQLVNGEKQKTFEEILPEIVIAKELSLLRGSTTNRTENFVGLKSVSLVHGRYPKSLLRQWDKYNLDDTSENDRPDMFSATQLFIIFVFEESGKSLENFEWSNLDEVRSIISQVVFSLAVAERSLEFEHRDLHWGNVLIRTSAQTTLDYCIDGQTKTVITCGLHVTIIDFTLSRLRKDGCTVFTDLSKDDTLFEGEGEYQFEIYRLMKKENSNNWGPHHPHSNVLWIHYLLDKLVNSRTLKGSRNTKHLRELHALLSDMLRYKSAQDLLSRCRYFMSQ